MNRSGKVYCRGILAGRIEERADGGCRFSYEAGYLASDNAKAVSLSLPLRREAFESPSLFSFFYGLLAEGILKDTQCRKLKLDENDHFGRLLKTTACDTIGDVTVVGDVES